METTTTKQFREAIRADPKLQAVTLEQIAETYAVSKRALLRYIAAGDLRAGRFGRRYMVTLAALGEFLNESNASKQAPAKRSKRKKAGAGRSG